ncbi:MAG: metal-dependent hydrolase [Flavobacteriales bacterium]|nr:MAG: metal-dependent hydrolase [Flavobacteriales bacterium]
MKNILLILITSIFYSCSYETEKNNQENCTMYYNGTILTMEGKEPAYIEAVVVLNDEIVFIGNKETAKKEFQKAKLYDLKGTTLTPGFIEPHLHPSLGSAMMNYEIIAPFDWDLPSGKKKGVKNQDEFIKQVGLSIKNRSKENELFFIWGYHQLWHGEISRELLNKVAGNQPVAILHRSFHEIFLNDAAIDLIGIKEADFSSNPQVSWNKGHFYEGGWLELVPHMAQILFDQKKYAFGLAEMTKLIQSNGITTIAEPGFPSTDFNLEYYTLKDEMDKMPFYDTYLIANGTQLNGMKNGNENALNFINELTKNEEFSNKNLHFLPKQVKLFSDGAIYSQLMQMKDGYTDGHHGEWMTPLNLFNEQLQLYWKNNYKIHIHANGDLGIQRVLDLLEKVQNEIPRKNHRLTIHHMGYFDEAIAQECKNLGVEASVNPYYLWALSDKYSEHGLGPERSENLVAINTLISKDIPVSFHSDFSMAPLEPLKLVWTAVNRISANGVKHSQKERIKAYDAMKCITINAARTLDLEEKIGSIKVGKQANFTILEENPITISPKKIKDIKIIGTIFNGRINKL